MNDAEPIIIDPAPSSAGWHRLSDFLKCPRLFALNAKAKALDEAHSHAPSDAIVRGTLIHTVLAHHYARRLPGGGRYADPATATFEIAERLDAKNPSPLWRSWAERCVNEFLPAYRAKWGEEKVFEVLAVEREIRATVILVSGEKVAYTGRLDLLVRHRATSRIYNLDHKTAYAIVPKVVNRYALSGQIAGYNRILRGAYGSAFAGTILNFVGVPQKGNDPWRFARPVLETAPAAADDLPNTIRFVEASIRQLRETVGPEATSAARWPAVYQDGPPCMGPFGPCPHRDICRGVVRA